LEQREQARFVVGQSVGKVIRATIGGIKGERERRLKTEYETAFYRFGEHL
jgi:hypothetical protein